MRARFGAAFARFRKRMFSDPRRELVEALIADIQRQDAKRTMMHVRLRDLPDEAELCRAERKAAKKKSTHASWLAWWRDVTGELRRP